MVCVRERAPAVAAGSDVLRTAVTLCATAATALLFHLGTGLHPIPWVTWLAPLPVLAVAPRVRALTAALAAFGGYALGALGFARYLAADLETPPVAVAATVAATSLVYTGVVLLFRALVREGRPGLAALASPAAWTAAEYVVSVTTSAGSNWSLGNAQADLVPVVQVAALTGVFGISFLVFGLSAAVAVAVQRSVPTRRRWTVLAVAGGVLLAALGYGAARRGDDHAPTLTVTLVAAHGPGYIPTLDSEAGRDLVEDDLAWLRRMPVGSTDLVVFPEKDVEVEATELADLERDVAVTVAGRGAIVVLGIAERTPAGLYNTALVFPADGRPPTAYHKQHPVPGVEDDVTPGTTDAFVSGRPDVGVAICADLGHPALGRSYTEGGARLLAVPALDFDVDDWSQSRVQLMRGVESGFAVARAARQGFLTLSDQHGRVLAQRRTGGDADYTTVTAQVPLGTGPTPYARWGDWFGQLCLVLTAGGLGVALRGRRSAPR